VHFSQSNQNKISELIDLYKKVKAIILYCEELDEDQYTNLQIPKELRDAFDHLMRAISEAESNVENADVNTISKNIDKSIGHVFRAGFDSVDGASMSLKEQIVTSLKPYHSSAILKALPDYGKMKIEVENISAEIAKHREKKDITFDGISSVFNNYITNLDKLRSIYKKILLALPSINEFQQERRKDKIKSIVWTLVIGLIITLVSFLLGRITSP